MADIITCPSGLQGRVRGMKVREESVLADRKLAKSGAQIDELLAACWEETLDAGPLRARRERFASRVEGAAFAVMGLPLLAWLTALIFKRRRD